VFLLALVTCASLMPVERLPAASWQTAFGLGFISAVFDNIPLTALAIKQGGYDWGMLAYTVGFGGSMIWFGSSAGVALSNMYPQAKSVGAWVRHGWHVALAYVVGFVVMLALLGWNPHEPRKAPGALSLLQELALKQLHRPGIEDRVGMLEARELGGELLHAQQCLAALDLVDLSPELGERRQALHIRL
jgi:hypothetical protein